MSCLAPPPRSCMGGTGTRASAVASAKPNVLRMKAAARAHDCLMLWMHAVHSVVHGAKFFSLLAQEASFRLAAPAAAISMVVANPASHPARRGTVAHSTDLRHRVRPRLYRKQQTVRLRGGRPVDGRPPELVGQPQPARAHRLVQQDAAAARRGQGLRQPYPLRVARRRLSAVRAVAAQRHAAAVDDRPGGAADRQPQRDRRGGRGVAPRRSRSASTSISAAAPPLDRCRTSSAGARAPGGGSLAKLRTQLQRRRMLVFAADGPCPPTAPPPPPPAPCTREGARPAAAMSARASSSACVALK